MWKKIELDSGTAVEGNKSAPPTRWWNHLWLALFGWKIVVTFRVPKTLAESGYYIGYSPIMGGAMYNTEICHDEHFSMKVGHEDCKFFALPVETTQPPCSPTIVARSRLH